MATKSLLLVCLVAIFSIQTIDGAVRREIKSFDEQIEEMWTKVNKTIEKIDSQHPYQKSAPREGKFQERLREFSNDRKRELTEEFKQIEAEARKTGVLIYEMPQLVYMNLLTTKSDEIHKTASAGFEDVVKLVDVQTRKEIDTIVWTITEESVNNTRDLYNEIKTHQNVWEKIDFGFGSTYFSQERDLSKYDSETREAFKRAKDLATAFQSSLEKKGIMIQKLIFEDMKKNQFSRG